MSYQLQVAETANCVAGSYSPVPTDTSGHWQIVDSPFITDGEQTFNIDPGLTDDVLTFIPGELKDAGNNIQFAWAGSTERGQAHYYRVQAPSFLIEYDNIQNKANHIHSVWRDWEGDFGLDLLKAHYDASH